MESISVLQTVGQVAGIGGVALGALLMIFRDVIRKNIFPNLQQRQAYRLIKLIVVLTFSIAALGIGAWAYVQRPSPEPQTLSDSSFPEKNPEVVIQNHLGLTDQEKYSEAYEGMAIEAKKRFQRDFVISTFVSQRKPKGASVSRTLYGISTLRQLPDGTKGAFAVGAFITQFSNGEKLIESVTVMAEDGSWRVLFHQFNPCVPPYCPS